LGDIARARGEEGDELAVAAARNGVRHAPCLRIACVGIHVLSSCISQIGRTSTTP
jgi:hypothetical protein